MNSYKRVTLIMCGAGAAFGLASAALAASPAITPPTAAQLNAANQASTFFSVPTTVPQPSAIPPAAVAPSLPSPTPAPYQSQIPNVGGTPNAPGPSVGGPLTTPSIPAASGPGS